MNLLFNNRLVSISSKILIGCFVVLAYGLIQGHSASAGTCTFASTEPTNSWHVAANWGCGGVPTSTSPVVIPAATTTYILANTAATAGSVTITGTLKPWGSTLSVNGNWTKAGTFTAGTSTIDFTGTAAQTINSVTTFNNVTVTKASGTVTAAAAVTIDGTLATAGGGTLDMQGNALSVALTTAIGALTTVTSTSGTLTFTGAVTNVGNIGTVSGSELFASTLDNSGTLSLGAGTATSTGSLTNTGTINQESGKLALIADYSGAGTFNGQAGTTWFYGTANQSIRGVTFYNVEFRKSAGTVTIVTADVTLDGTLTMEGAGTLNAADRALTALHGVSIVGSTVTSTTGTLSLAGIANAGFIGSSYGNMLFPSLSFANASGVLNIGHGTATSTITFPGDGTINGNSGTIVLAANTANVNFIWPTGATFNAQSGTVKYARATGAQGVNCSYTYNNLNIQTVGGDATLSANCMVNGTLFVGSASTLNADIRSLTVAGASTIAGTATSTSGTLTFNGAVINSGSIGSVDGNTMFGSTLANSGILNVGAGVATTTGTLDNSGGTINCNTGKFALVANFISPAPGTFNANTCTVTFYGTANQSIRGMAFYNLENRKSAGTATFNTADVTVANVFDTYVGGTLSAGSVNFTVSGGTTIRASTTVTSTSGTLAFAAVNNAGSLGSSSGPITMTSLTNSGTLGLGAESTSTGSITSSGTIRLNGETLNVGGNWTDTGTLTPVGGGVKFNGGGAQSIGTEASFYNFGVNKLAGVATLTGNVSTTNFLLTAGTLAVADKIFYAPGNYGNAGLVTRTTGKIKHAASYKNFVNASGVTQTSYTTPGAIYLEVKDNNRNMNGAAVETLTVPLVVNAAGGGDSETVTLTETGVATGIFRSGLVGLYTGTTIVPGNGEVIISASGIGTETYTDNQDATDTGATTATLTYSTGVVTPPGGGGGGLPPVTTQFQSETSDPNRTTYLNNLSSMGLPVNSLVKLPDDNNGATQEDSAVYYIGSDGKRHAFPNSKIYFTWYKDFSGVRIITAEQLASIPLGSNVRYKPGSRMVKFTTDPKVYAVDANGVLRWVKTAAAATALYGDNWNTFIDDMTDAFFTNYSFGSDIDSAADFNASTAMSLEATISDNLGKA